MKFVMKIFSVEDVAHTLGVSATFFRDAIRAGDVPAPDSRTKNPSKTPARATAINQANTRGAPILVLDKGKAARSYLNLAEEFVARTQRGGMK